MRGATAAPRRRSCRARPPHPSSPQIRERHLPDLGQRRAEHVRHVPHRPAEGLSPRVWGNPATHAAPPPPAGSIPACAGEPPPRCAVAAPSRVYPRVCGGTTSRSCSGSPYRGSIPACAGEPWRCARRWRAARVYPRVCGGTAIVARKTVKPPGLSLRVRGNPPVLLLGPRPLGSIPACAGEPTPPTAGTPRPTVYPRVCGGTGRISSDETCNRGLSPRVRGNHKQELLGLAVPGVYPRVCGGTLAVRAAVEGRAGLSPRVRGNRDRGPQDGKAPGSIPACAGEPAGPAPRPTPARVYPRVCGGTQTGMGEAVVEEGLSPRVRGNRDRRDLHVRREGSIPACAGEPARMTSASLPAGVYPRVCGGTSHGIDPCDPASGLSPRVRGNPDPRALRRARFGSIPACAGEPRMPRGPTSHCWVYPRVCGGTQTGMGEAVVEEGLSPRVRGNPHHPRHRHDRPGSIPACAGEPCAPSPAAPP